MLSFWLSSLLLPKEVLEHLWKADGHLVPSEIENLISMLKAQKTAVVAKQESLRKDYDAYLSFCASLNLDPVTVPSAKQPEMDSYQNILGIINPASSEDVLKNIPLTFSEISKLRDLDRSLKDLDGLIDLLSKILERFRGSAISKDDSLRLYIGSSGKGLSFRLVYEPASTLKQRQARASQTRRGTVRPRSSTSTSFDVQSWIELGQKALMEKAGLASAQAQ